MAGGYDERVTENKEHYEELCNLVAERKLENHVTFLRSFSDDQKRTLLHHSSCLLYTPDREHFGIVPIEAMYMKCPVIAVSSGGPLETVVVEQTGFLCSPTAADFASAMERIVDDKGLSKVMGESGNRHVTEKFSFDAFTEQLNGIVQRVCSEAS